MMKEISAMISQLQVETDAAYLYRVLAARETNPANAKIYRSLSEIEAMHASQMVEKVRKHLPGFKAPGPGRSARFQAWLGGIIGYDLVLSNLMAMEERVGKSVMQGRVRAGLKPSGYELNHFRIVEALAGSPKDISGRFLSRIEGRHKSPGGNALRAAVLGANDGLVSNMSLVMGVAGAAMENNTILITGIAGLLAGSISMALGEWLSVQSARELVSKQVALEAEELESSPETEEKELSLLYQAKGMQEQEARELAKKVFENPETALDVMVTEELGIDREDSGGSAWEAAITSFLFFAAGAIIPIIPFFFMESGVVIYASVISSVLGLFLIGAAITLFTGKNILYSGFRQVLFGLTASAITFGIGKMIGVAIS